MADQPNPLYPCPPYTGPLRELAPPVGDHVRVEFACPHCGVILQREAALDETRWYLPSCNFGHSGVGIQDPRVVRIRAY